MIRNKKKPVVRSSKPKPINIPKDFVLVIDTREQKPLFTRPQKGLLIVRDTLKDGDYSVRGFEDQVCVERKGVSDFYGYIGKERTRTVKKLERMRGMFWAMLLIDAKETEIMSRQSYSKLTPEHARGFLTSLNVRYGISHQYIQGESADRFILDRLVKAYRILRGE